MMSIQRDRRQAERTSGWVRLLPLALCLVAVGCIGKRPSNPAATQPATAIDPKYAQADYWLAEPAHAQVAGRDFTTLWEISEEVARSYLFEIDRRDHRSGLLSTEPMISKQFFEFWRKDAGTFDDVKEASLATIRRTIFFQFAQNPDGSYTVTPKVLVERQSKVAAQDRDELEDRELPSTYWYALRRDKVMEQKLADAILKRIELRGPTAAGTQQAP